MRNEHDHTETDSGILYLTTILDDMWRGFKKFFPLCLILIAAGSAGFYVRAQRSYSPSYQAYSSFVVDTKTAYVYNQEYSNKTTAGQLSKTFPYILTSGALADIVADSLDMDTIPASITAESISDTAIFTINVTASDPNTAYDVLQAVIKYYPRVAEYIIGNTQLTQMDESGIPDSPVNPPQFQQEAVKGGVAGLALSAVFLFFYSITRRTVRREEDLKAHLSIPYLGSVPKARGKRRKESGKTILLDKSGNNVALHESFRTIRTRTVKKSELDGVRSILVTSAATGEGKTTVAANLAISLAKKGKRVILVDGDLRNPSITKAMGLIPKEHGVVNVLEQNAELKDVIVRYEVYGLDILPGGAPMKDPSVVLGNGLMEKLLKVLSRKYDYVIIDTPPCGMLSDASAIARMVDGAVIVVRQDQARIDRILAGVENIADTGVDLIGYVLNGTEMGVTGYGYGYGYGYRYGYGHYGKNSYGYGEETK